MEILKIDNGKGFFLMGGIKKTILDISKDDILEILKQIYINKDCEFDEMSDTNPILNEAEKTIYTNLYAKFVDFDSKKVTLKNETNNMFVEIIEKYSKTKEEDDGEDFEF